MISSNVTSPGQSVCHKNSISEVEWVAGKELAPGSDLYVDILFAEWGWGQERALMLVYFIQNPCRMGSRADKGLAWTSQYLG